MTIGNLSTTPFFADGPIESPGVANASYHWLDATRNVVKEGVTLFGPQASETRRTPVRVG